ncbi:MAG: hypothetical protein R3C10_10085 [Pirellulales bacterium]
MSHTSAEPDPAPDDPRLMAKWARAYGQNRSLGVAVFIVIFVALFAAIGIPSHFAGEALRAGNTPVLWVALAALAVAAVAMVFLATPRWGGNSKNASFGVSTLRKATSRSLRRRRAT